MLDKNLKSPVLSKFKNDLSNFYSYTLTKKEYDEIMKNRTRPIGEFRTLRNNSFKVDSN